MRSSGSQQSGEDLSRIFAFIRAIDEGTSSATKPFQWGTAYFNTDLPRVYSLNFLDVRGGQDITSEKLMAVADELQGAAGLGHRKIVCRDETLGHKLMPEFRAKQWDVECDVVMVHSRPPDRASPPGLAVEIGRAEAAGVFEEVTRREPHGKDDETVSQLVRRLDAISRATNLRFFGARIDGHLAAYCELYSDAHTAQIESVSTLEEYRGRGLARAMTLAALRAATESGCDLTFLFADEQDWPKELYTKLGFETIGRSYDFTKSHGWTPRG